MYVIAVQAQVSKIFSASQAELLATLKKMAYI
jgi:hypothetical protein